MGTAEIPLSPDRFEAVVADLAARGWSVHPGFLDPAETALLREECLRRWRADEFARAGIGHGDDFRLRPDIRSDRVAWLDPANPTPRQQLYLVDLEQLRREVNGRLFLGLFEFEGHFAVYPPGARYARHLDRFHDDDTRALTCILYLNPDWHPDHGGLLRLYAGDATVDVEPRDGTLVSFLSGEFEHEVLAARRERLSLTGWFRRRGG